MKEKGFKLVPYKCCTTAASTASPPNARCSDLAPSCFSLREKMTLTSLFNRLFLSRRNRKADYRKLELNEGLLTSHRKLKDLFVCSPPNLVNDNVRNGREVGGLRRGLEEYPSRSRRFGSMRLRCRLFKGGRWRPRLTAIDEE